MSSPEQQVFDNLLLRNKILTKIEYSKYKNELKVMIQDILDDAIIHNWYKFCNCELCTLQRQHLLT